MTMKTVLTKTALSLGLMGALAVSAASPSLAWTHRARVHHNAAAAAVNGAVAGVGLAANAALGAAATYGYDPGPFGPAYAYEPLPAAYGYGPGIAYGGAYAAAPGYPLGGAYAYEPGFVQGPVTYDAGGAAIYPSQIGPGCPVGQAMGDRC